MSVSLAFPEAFTDDAMTHEKYIGSVNVQYTGATNVGNQQYLSYLFLACTVPSQT